MNHKNYGGMHWKAEGDSKYFAEGCTYENAYCQKCEKTIVNVVKNEKEQFRPTSGKPVWVCENREKDGCMAMCCNDCYVVEIAKADSGRARKRTRR